MPREGQNLTLYSWSMSSKHQITLTVPLLGKKGGSVKVLESPPVRECCILTLDWAINQRFLCTGCTYVNKQKPSHGWVKIWGIMKWYRQLPMWDTVNLELVLLCSVESAYRELWPWRGHLVRTGWVYLIKEEKMCGLNLKITQHYMIKRRGKSHG